MVYYLPPAGVDLNRYKPQPVTPELEQARLHDSLQSKEMTRERSRRTKPQDGEPDRRTTRTPAPDSSRPRGQGADRPDFVGQARPHEVARGNQETSSKPKERSGEPDRRTARTPAPDSSRSRGQTTDRQEHRPQFEGVTPSTSGPSRRAKTPAPEASTSRSRTPAPRRPQYRNIFDDPPLSPAVPPRPRTSNASHRPSHSVNDIAPPPMPSRSKTPHLPPGSREYRSATGEVEVWQPIAAPPPPAQRPPRTPRPTPVSPTTPGGNSNDRGYPRARTPSRPTRSHTDPHSPVYPQPSPHGYSNRFQYDSDSSDEEPEIIYPKNADGSEIIFPVNYRPSTRPTTPYNHNRSKSYPHPDDLPSRTLPVPPVPSPYTLTPFPPRLAEMAEQLRLSSSTPSPLSPTSPYDSDGHRRSKTPTSRSKSKPRAGDGYESQDPKKKKVLDYIPWLTRN
jgi:hypothetical protein